MDILGKNSLKKQSKKSLLDNFLSHVPSSTSMTFQSNRKESVTDKYALYAWSVQLYKRAKKIKNVPEYDKRKITIEFMRELARLSTKENGPVKNSKRINEKRSYTAY